MEHFIEWMHFMFFNQRVDVLHVFLPRESSCVQFQRFISFILFSVTPYNSKSHGTIFHGFLVLISIE